MIRSKTKPRQKIIRKSDSSAKIQRFFHSTSLPTEQVDFPISVIMLIQF